MFECGGRHNGGSQLQAENAKLDPIELTFDDHPDRSPEGEPQAAKDHRTKGGSDPSVAPAGHEKEDPQSKPETTLDRSNLNVIAGPEPER